MTDTIHTVTLTPQEQAAFESGRKIGRKIGWNEGIEAAVRIQDDGCTCLGCGTFFLGSDFHDDEDCPNGRAAWDVASDEQKTAAIRALSMPAPAQAWRDISTAPKDGTHVLGADGLYVDVFWFSEGLDGWACATTEDFGGHNAPTHWMPLPAPPAALIPASEDDGA